ncbi:MAG: 2-succinyl-5-enolpyruvyl-6-hydroxy-3-cyclohexene-1-carboxylic-acid synthase [Candidatus Sericytochromatia bacterium]
MPVDATNLNLLWTSLLIEELIRHGSNYFCLSPGSRSAPLAVAIARNPRANALVCYDERAAAFHALGWARATGRPAVLACTSGTAMAHYLPAIVEAAQDGVPMLILTADRPPELIDVGANQAIRQSGLYREYVRWSCDFPCPSLDVPPQWVLSTADQALYRCLEPEPGPVHLNLPFREPLAPQPQQIPAACLEGIQDWLGHGKPYCAVSGDAFSANSEVWDELVDRLNSTRKGLVILGKLRPAEREGLIPLLGLLGWPVFADALSGLSLNSGLTPLVPHFDQLLEAEAFRAACQPQTVLQIGGGFVSGRLLKHLAACPPRHYFQLLADTVRQDPNHQVTHRVHGKLIGNYGQLILEAEPDPDPDFGRVLQEMARKAEAVFAGLDQAEDLSEPGVARLLTQLAPASHVLMLGNSLPVREVDGFAAPRTAALDVFANRGTSGIDGHVATAAGIAAGRRVPVTLLCGDLTLFHDLNSLHLLSRIDQPVTIVVINNGGGGIFSFLPIHEHEDIFEPWFGTPHQLSFAGAASMFGLDYCLPASRSELVQALQKSWAQGSPALIEVVTQRPATLALHRQLQQQLTTKLSEQEHKT